MQLHVFTFISAKLNILHRRVNVGADCVQHLVVRDEIVSECDEIGIQGFKTEPGNAAPTVVKIKWPSIGLGHAEFWKVYQKKMISALSEQTQKSSRPECTEIKVFTRFLSTLMWVYVNEWRDVVLTPCVQQRAAFNYNTRLIPYFRSESEV